MRREEYEPKGLRWAVDYDCQRPRLIQIFKSSNAQVEGVTLKRPGFWDTAYLVCAEGGRRRRDHPQQRRGPRSALTAALRYRMQ
jgi:hypothetical protein